MSAAVVEVKDDDTFAYYQAYIKDLKDGQVLVRYENGWRTDAWVAPHKVRQAVALHDPNTFNPQVGDSVEAMAKSHEDEPFSWWQAKVKTIRGEFFLINYSDWDDTYNEIVEKELLRPVNPNPVLSADNLVKKEIKIPKDLWETDAEKADASLQQHKQRKYKDMQTQSNLLSLIDDPNRHVLMILGPKAAVQKADLMAPMYFKHRREYRALHTRSLQKQTRLEEEKQKLERSFIEEFSIDPELVSLVIGKKGNNIKAAQALPGVLRVHVLDDKGVVRVVAENEEAIKAVRRRLEYVARPFPVPRNLLGRIIGKGGAFADIRKTTGVVSIRVHNNNKGPEASITITGTQETVGNAMILLQQHVAHIQELGDHWQEVQQVDQQLRQLNMSYGYNGENDEFSGGGRGGGRGGRRGGRGGGRGGRSEQNGDGVEEKSHGPVRGGRGGRGGRRGGRGGGTQGSAQPLEVAASTEDTGAAAAAPAAAPKKRRNKKGNANGNANAGAQQGNESKTSEKAQPAAAAAASSADAPADGQQPKRRQRKPRKPKGDSAAAAASPAAAE